MQIFMYIFLFVLIALLCFFIVRQVIGLITDIKKRKRLKEKHDAEKQDEIKIEKKEE